MGYNVAGKNVLVTGGSSGIGAALAEGFAEAGATVGICARRTDRLAAVLERMQAHSPGSRSWTVDLADLDRLDDFARRVEDDLGGVDVLVNNAGIPKRRTVFALTPEVVEQVMRVNYLSPVRLTLALLPGIVERAGRIITISSVAARLSPPGEAAYAASKAALSAWMECMQIDLRDTDVKVHLVNPGVVDTELFAIPDNDPTIADIAPLPADALVAPVLEMLEHDRFEIYLPEWFKDVVAVKASDIDGFIQGSIDYTRSREAARREGAGG